MNTDKLIEKYLNKKNKKKKVNEASGAGTSYESMWNQWWSRPYMILVRDEMVLHSNDPMYPTGSTMTSEDRQKAAMKGYTVLDW
jgi:hypothetical protein